MRCWECKKSITQARIVHYVAESCGEAYAEKPRDVCDNCLPKLQFNSTHHVVVERITHRQTKEK